MASFDLKVQLINHVTALFKEGLLNDQFHQLELLKGSHSQNSGFLMCIITKFIDGTETLLVQVDNILNKDAIDFSKLYHVVYKLRGSCAMVGAHNMMHALLPMIQCCKTNDKDRCMEALQNFRHEYQTMRAKLETIVQLEKIILHDGQN